jgi:hypothetical protein
METKEQVKISTAQAAQVYAEVPKVLRKLASERDTLSEKLAAAELELGQYRLSERMAKVAGKMHEKGVNRGLSMEEHFATIKEAVAQGRSLDAIEEAVEMTAPDGSFAKIAADDVGGGTGASQLETFLLGGLAD